MGEIGLGSCWEGGEGVASKFTGNRWGDRGHNNQPLTGASEADGGLQPAQRATTKGEDNDNNEEEGSSTLDMESSCWEVVAQRGVTGQLGGANKRVA